MNFIYPDEIVNYYFILKGKDHDNIQINFENSNKNENIIFTKDKMIKEPDGELIGQIIVGNKLKNEENMEEEKIIKLSKDYQILSKKTSLFAVAENEENNKVGEMKQITKKEKKGLFDVFMANNMNNMNNNIDIGSQLNNNNVNYMSNIKMELNNNMNNMMNMNINNNMNMNMMMDSAPKRYNNNIQFNSLNYNNNYSRPMRSMAAMEAAPNNKSDDSDEDDYKYKKKLIMI